MALNYSCSADGHERELLFETGHSAQGAVLRLGEGGASARMVGEGARHLFVFGAHKVRSSPLNRTNRAAYGAGGIVSIDLRAMSGRKHERLATNAAAFFASKGAR